VTKDNAVAAPAAVAVRFWEVWLLVGLLVTLAAVLASLARKTGVTIDEPSHLLSAHLYWKGADTLQPGDMPPMIKIAGGWVSHLFELPVPYEHPEWPKQREWELAQAMMERLRAPALQQIFFYSRLPMIVFPLLTCVTLWLWARRLFSRRTAMVLALLFCLSPTVLAHGALFKNDMAASFGYLLFWYRAWMYWQAPSGRNALWLGVSLFVAILAKMSLLILLVVVPAILAARYIAPPRRGWRLAAADAAVILLVVYVGTCAAWQFQVDQASSIEVEQWRESLPVARWASAPMAALSLIPTPSRLRQGALSLLESNAQGAGVYLLGNVYPEGHPLYFVVAIGTKVPLPLQILTLTSLLLLAADCARRKLCNSDLLWLIPPLLYLALASVSSLQLGVRLILPSLVFLLLWSGRATEFLLSRRGTAAAGMILAAWLGVRTAWVYPNYIAYFNTLAGGSHDGLRYLSDSNLDWGQDLPALAEYLETHPIGKVRLAYFGTDNPAAHLPEQRYEQIAPPWSDHLVSGPRIEPSPGYYAISATLLTGQLFQPRYRDYFRVFRESTPVAKAGYSIFVYRVQ
jgi:hypothetical protein